MKKKKQPELKGQFKTLAAYYLQRFIVERHKRKEYEKVKKRGGVKGIEYNVKKQRLDSSRDETKRRARAYFKAVEDSPSSLKNKRIRHKEKLKRKADRKEWRTIQKNQRREVKEQRGAKFIRIQKSNREHLAQIMAKPQKSSAEIRASQRQGIKEQNEMINLKQSSLKEGRRHKKIKELKSSGKYGQYREKVRSKKKARRNLKRIGRRIKGLFKR